MKRGPCRILAQSLCNTRSIFSIKPAVVSTDCGPVLTLGASRASVDLVQSRSGGPNQTCAFPLQASSTCPFTVQPSIGSLASSWRFGHLIVSSLRETPI